jgi:hypothetical protein
MNTLFETFDTNFENYMKIFKKNSNGNIIILGGVFYLMILSKYLIRK